MQCIHSRRLLAPSKSLELSKTDLPKILLLDLSVDSAKLVTSATKTQSACLCDQTQNDLCYIVKRFRLEISKGSVVLLLRLTTMSASRVTQRFWLNIFDASLASLLFYS